MIKIQARLTAFFYTLAALTGEEKQKRKLQINCIVMKHINIQSATLGQGDNEVKTNCS